MPKDFAVVLLEDNARIIKDPALIDTLSDKGNVLINPVLGHLSGCPPHFWKKSADGRSLEEMTRIEKDQRMLLIQSKQNLAKKKAIKEQGLKKNYVWVKYALLVGLGFILAKIVVLFN